jgi:hypothetical protein
VTNVRGLPANRIAELHNALTRTFNGFVSHAGGLFIGSLQPPEDDRNAPKGWRAAGPGVVLHLHLLPKRGELFYRMAPRERGGEVPMLALKDVRGAGISWYERVQSFGDGTYSLRAVSLTLWHDFGGGTPPAQVLRAEWDGRDEEGTSTAQPHWHVDVDLPVAAVHREPPGQPEPEVRLRRLTAPGPQGLEELTGALSADAAPPPRVTISPYHLGMRANWVGSSASHTWATAWDPKLVDVPAWVRLCLRHLISQHERFGVRPTKRRAAGAADQ